jgi:hypothetical protein
MKCSSVLISKHFHSLIDFLLIFMIANVRARTRELPGTYPFVVQQSFIKSIIEQWASPAHVLCKTVFGLLVDHIQKLVSAHFRSFGQGGLEQRVKSVVLILSQQL